MDTRTDAAGCRQWVWLLMAALVFLLGQSVAFAQPSCCSGSGCCGGPPEQACTLTYGARGVVRDSVTGEPIPNALVTVLILSGSSEADGSFDVSASRHETCHVDYYYTLLVTAPGYDPYELSLYTSAVYPTLAIELDPEGASDPDATPTPTRTVYPGPSPTAIMCPIKTPCVLGEHPRPCGDPCGLGCGCEPCGECPRPGWVPAPRPNVCDCVPDPNATPPPPPTPGNCFFPTPPHCAIGETAQCGGCNGECSCVSCEPCPPGLSYSGERNSCICLDPRTVTPTPTTDTRSSTPTPSPDSGETPLPCPTTTPISCPIGEASECDTSVDPCGICECRAVPQGPGDDDSTLSPSSGSGCGVAAPSDADWRLWSSSLLWIAIFGWRRARQLRLSPIADRRGGRS